MLNRINDLITAVWLTLTGALRPATARRGAGMLEYALLGLVALALFLIIYSLRGPIRGLIDDISAQLGA